MNRRIFSFWMSACAVSILTADVSGGEKLVHKFKKGSKVVYRAVTETEQLQNIMGNDMESTIRVEQVIQLTTENIKDNGHAILKVKVHEARFKGSIEPLGEFEFDPKSDDNDQSSMLGAAITPVFELLNGAEYTLEVKPSGTIVAVTGYGEMFESVIEQNPLSAQFIGGGTNESARSELQELFVEYSDKPADSGLTWKVEHEDDLPNLGKFSSETTMTIQGSEKVNGKDSLRIDVSSDIKIELDLEQPGAKITGELTASGGQSETFVDPKTGQLVQTEGSADFSGTLTVDAGGMMIPIESSQTRHVLVKLLDKLPK